MVKRWLIQSLVTLTLWGGAYAQPYFKSKEISTPTPTGTFRAYNSYDWKNLKSTHYKPKDIRGNEVDIQGLLDQGKKVLIDFSTTWCVYCWTMHQNHLLEKAHQLFGPTGTKRQDLVVLWVENEGAPVEKIKNPKKNWAVQYGTETEVPYSIISDQNLAAELGLSITDYPTLLLLAPTGQYMDAFEFFEGYKTFNSSAFEKVLSDIPSPKDAPTAVKAQTLEFGYTNEPVAWKATCLSGVGISGYQWEFEGADITSSKEAEPKVVWSKPGTYKVALTISNTNGSTREELNYVIKDINVTQFPVSSDFEEELFPAQEWRRLSLDGDPFSWEPIQGMFSRVGLSPDQTLLWGYNSSGYLVSWTFRPTSIKQGNKGIEFFGDDLKPKDWLFSPVLNIPANAPKPTLFFATNSFFEAPFDSYRVLVSTTSTYDPNAFTRELKKGLTASTDRKWKHESIDLSEFRGKRITLAFVHEARLLNRGNVCLDALHISLDGTVGISHLPQAENVSVYPTITHENIFVATENPATIVLFDIRGCQIECTSSLGGVISLSTSTLPNGTYFVRVTEPNGAIKVVRVLVHH